MPFERPTWPGGARCAVTLTFDNFGESLDLLHHGHAGGALADGVYAPRRGVERVLDLLDRHGIPGTFFVEGWNARKYAALLREVAARGHEVGAHGWMHEQWDKLAPDEERDLIARATDAIADVLGRPPRGWRSPGGLITTSTLALLKDAGYQYDSSFSDDDVPYLVAVSADRPNDELVELPWTWPLDDAPFYGNGRGIRPPREVIAAWQDEYDAALELTGFFSAVCHPRFTGRPSRVIAFETLVRHVEASGAAWFARCEEVARWAGGQPWAPRYAAPAIADR
jgi:peptidoglycan/xylan/chitin deacetylase (PgdA/CDA1 family)